MTDTVISVKIKTWRIQRDVHWRFATDDVPFMMQVYPICPETRALTGVPMVLNTSFNENEPVVCRQEEALDCFLRTKMDVLVMGNWYIAR